MLLLLLQFSFTLRNAAARLLLRTCALDAACSSWSGVQSCRVTLMHTFLPSSSSPSSSAMRDASTAATLDRSALFCCLLTRRRGERSGASPEQELLQSDKVLRNWSVSLEVGCLIVLELNSWLFGWVNLSKCQPPDFSRPSSEISVRVMSKFSCDLSPRRP